MNKTNETRNNQYLDFLGYYSQSKIDKDLQKALKNSDYSDIIEYNGMIEQIKLAIELGVPHLEKNFESSKKIEKKILQKLNQLELPLKDQ